MKTDKKPNQCEECEEETYYRCSSCKKVLCDKCLDNHLDMKLVSPDNWEDYKETIV